MNFLTPSISAIFTVEPRYDEGPRDCQNVFVITRFGYIEGFFTFFRIFYYYWGKENCLLYRGHRYKGSTQSAMQANNYVTPEANNRLDVPTLLDIRFNKFIFKE